MLIQCEFCEKALRVPEAAIGKAIRCPSCRQILEIPARATESRIPDRPEKRPSTSRTRSDTKRVEKIQEDIEDYDADSGSMPAANDLQSFATSIWSQLNPFNSNTFDPWQNQSDSTTRSAANVRLTGLGLLITSGSLSVLLASMLLTMVAPIFVGVPQAAAIVLIGVTTGIASVGWTIGGIGLVVGFVLCMFIPKSSRAKKHISQCVMLLLAQFGSICIHLTAEGLLPIRYFVRSPFTYSAQAIGSAILAIQIICFGRFLKSAMQYARIKHLGERAESATLALCVTFLIWIFVHMALSIASPYLVAVQVLATVLETATGIGLLVTGAAFLMVTFKAGIALRRFY